MDGHAFSKMDRNKSTHKLQGLPAIYWLNLDADTDRRFYMEEQFKYWNINNHTRISGYDAREDDAAEYLKGRIPDNVSQTELGCCMSHLKAIKHFYEETDDEYCMILEDDVDFSIVRFWNFTWQEFFGLAPYDWDCLQLTTICTGDIGSLSFAAGWPSGSCSRIFRQGVSVSGSLSVSRAFLFFATVMIFVFRGFGDDSKKNLIIAVLSLLEF